jgi:hypothetical protein
MLHALLFSSLRATERLSITANLDGAGLGAKERRHSLSPVPETWKVRANQEDTHTGALDAISATQHVGGLAARPHRDLAGPRR